jgi:hypothetical protein
MGVWHTKAENPSTSQKTVVPVPSDPQTEETTTEGYGEDLEAVTPISSAVPGRPKRKRGNDSVSHIASDSKFSDSTNVAFLD